MTAVKRAAYTAARSAGTAARRAAPYAWATTGLALLSAAAWTYTTTAGLAAAGISCLIMEWRVRGT